MLAAFRARELGRSRDRVCCRVDVVGRDQEAGHPVEDHFIECAAAEGHDGCPARLRLGGDHPERLLPPGRAQHDGRARHHLPDGGSRNAWMNRDARIVASRVDPFPGVFGVVAVAVDIDRDARSLRDLDRLGRSLLRAQPAGEDRALPALTATSGSTASGRTAAGSRRLGRRGAKRSPGARTRRQPLAARSRRERHLAARRQPPRPAVGEACARPARAVRVARLIAGASKAWLWTTSYRSSRTAA